MLFIYWAKRKEAPLVLVKKRGLFSRGSTCCAPWDLFKPIRLPCSRAWATGPGGGV